MTSNFKNLKTRKHETWNLKVVIVEKIFNLKSYFNPDYYDPEHIVIINE